MYRFVWAVLLLILTAGSAFGYEVVHIDAPEVNPVDPWYDAGPPPNSSNVEVTLTIDVRLDQLGEAVHAEVEVRVVVVTGTTDHVIATTVVRFENSPLGVVLTGTAKVCLWFNSSGGLAGSDGSVPAASSYDLACEAGPSGDNSPYTMIVPTSVQTGTNVVQCDKGHPTPVSSVYGRAALILVLVTAAAGAAVVYSRKRRLV